MHATHNITRKIFISINILLKHRELHIICKIPGHRYHKSSSMVLSNNLKCISLYRGNYSLYLNSPFEVYLKILEYLEFILIDDFGIFYKISTPDNDHGTVDFGADEVIFNFAIDLFYLLF
jgi:hypothetical protein